MTLQDFAHEIVQELEVELIYFNKTVDGAQPLQTILEVGKSQGFLRAIEIVECALVSALEEGEDSES